MKLKLILLIQLRRDWEDSFLGRSRASKRKERTRDGIRATILARFFARSAQWGSFNATGEQRGIANVCRRVLTPSFPLTTCGLLASLSLSLCVCVQARVHGRVRARRRRQRCERASERESRRVCACACVRACMLAEGRADDRSKRSSRCEYVIRNRPRHTATDRRCTDSTRALSSKPIPNSRLIVLRLYRAFQGHPIDRLNREESIDSFFSLSSLFSQRGDRWLIERGGD